MINEDKMITREKVFEKWITALRSGKYKQGKGQLMLVEDSGIEHCCLGVLCEVAKKNGIISRYYGVNGGLPQKLAKFMDMDTAGQLNVDIAGEHSLVDLNDGGYEKNSKSFKFIATLLEKRRHTLKSYSKS